MKDSKSKTGIETVYKYKVGMWREKKDKDIRNMKEDMLKMIDVIERNEMHIKQLNWKFNNHIGHNRESELTMIKKEILNEC